MRSIKLLVFLSFLTIASSCSKDSDRQETADENYIDKIYSLEDVGAGVDTIQVISLNYDNLKRVTSMSDGFNENWAYFYNGNEQNPYKAIIESYGYPPDTFYFSYNAAGLKIKDSIHHNAFPFAYTSVRAYVYEPGKIISYRHYPSMPDLFSRDTALLDARGNILENFRHDYSTPPQTETNFVYSRFTFDDHPHPFSAMNIFNSNRNLPNGQTFYLNMFTPNNRVTQDEVAASTLNYNVDFSYEYNTNGFPTKITGGGSWNNDILVFTYRSL